jgi:hypothetical protein
VLDAKEEKSRGMYPGGERELRIERFMTTGLANRRLREVDGVSRNRLLVDKMIVWRTILGLIMASKWPPPESQSACRFSTTDAKGLVVKRKRDCAMRAPTPPNPRPIHKVSDFDVSHLRLCSRLPRLFSGRRRRDSIARIWRSGGGATICGSRSATYDLA